MSNELEVQIPYATATLVVTMPDGRRVGWAFEGAGFIEVTVEEDHEDIIADDYTVIASRLASREASITIPNIRQYSLITPPEPQTPAEDLDIPSIMP